MFLSQLKPGEVGYIGNIVAQPALRLRLMQLGFTKGARVKMNGCAPLGDPLEVWLRGSRFLIRGSDAACIEIEREVCTRGCKACPRGKSKQR